MIGYVLATVILAGIGAFLYARALKSRSGNRSGGGGGRKYPQEPY